jgi:hypothetical protein
MYILTGLLDSSLLRCTVYIFKMDTVYHQREKRVNAKSIVITGGSLGNRGRARPERIGEVVHTALAVPKPKVCYTVLQFQEFKEMDSQ